MKKRTLQILGTFFGIGSILDIWMAGYLFDYLTRGHSYFHSSWWEGPFIITSLLVGVTCFVASIMCFGISSEKK